MVGSKVQLREHVQIVINLRSLSQREAHALENVDNLVLHDGQRMASAQLDGVGSACQVYVVCRVLGCLALLPELVDASRCQLFQFVNLHSDSFLLVGSHVAEVLHQGIDLAFFAQVFQPELFNLPGIVGRNGADFPQHCLNLF